MATNKRTTANHRRSAPETLSKKADNVRQSVNELGSAAVDAAQEAAAHFRDTAAQRAADYRDAAAEQAEEVCDTASEYYSAGRERALDFEQTLEERIREKPLQSVLIAAGVGILIGVLWTRR
jgi:ElaB/YqjD/DUF883 family membrane-anchored ribosome-binding protein